MKLIKYEHACVTIEEDGRLLVIDPGEFTTDFVAPSGVEVIVITHEHPDHFDQELITSIMDKNPDAQIFAHESITTNIEAFSSHTVATGDSITAGPFTLAFHGGTHALINSSIPPIPNLGIMVNDLFYYPGDSFTLPGQPVDTLALPVAAPWLKISESIEFLLAVKPRLALPVHDAILSDKGQGIVDRLLGDIAKKNGIDYQRITEELEI